MNSDNTGKIGYTGNQNIIDYQRKIDKSLEQKALQKRKENLNKESSKSNDIGTKVNETDNAAVQAKKGYIVTIKNKNYGVNKPASDEDPKYKEANIATGSAEQGAYEPDAATDTAKAKSGIGLTAERKIYQTGQRQTTDKVNISNINKRGNLAEKIEAQSNQAREMDDTNMKITDKTAIGKKVDIIT